MRANTQKLRHAGRHAAGALGWSALVHSDPFHKSSTEPKKILMPPASARVLGRVDVDESMSVFTCTPARPAAHLSCTSRQLSRPLTAATITVPDLSPNPRLKPSFTAHSHSRSLSRGRQRLCTLQRFVNQCFSLKSPDSHRDPSRSSV